MYPLKFQPILKSTIWGGDKIIPFKNLDCQQAQVGESWEISDVPGDESVVADGADAHLRFPSFHLLEPAGSQDF